MKRGVLLWVHPTVGAWGPHRTIWLVAPKNITSARSQLLLRPPEVTRNPEAVDFEKLLGDLSAAFIRVSVEEIDNEIERWLQGIVLCLDVDRGTVSQFDRSDGVVSVKWWKSSKHR